MTVAANRSLWTRLSAAFLAAALGTWLPVAAQAPAITVNARLVVLDVVVTGPDGRPVNNLTADDFRVFEDGKVQRIRSVEPPSSHELPMESAAMDSVFDPARPTAFGHSPVDILMLDQLNTHFADASFARRSVGDYLSHQPSLLPEPTTLLSLYDDHFQSLHPFTRDRDALLRALAAAQNHKAWKLDLDGKAGHGPIDRLDQSLRALEEIAQSYAAIPGRKNLIWVGGGFPTIDADTVAPHDFQEVQQTLQHITDVLLETRVTVYAVDPTSSASSLTEITDESQAAFIDAAGDSLGNNAEPFNSSADFDKLGPVTGGRTIHGRNDIARQIASSADLGASFYTLAYTPSSTSDTEARYRSIRVVCLRPGLTARTRSGYYSGEPQQLRSAATYDLTTAAEGPMPLNGLHVTVERDPTNPGNFVIRAGVSKLTWMVKADGSASTSVYVLAVSLNQQNKMLSHMLQGMTANARAGTDLNDGLRTANFHLTVHPAPKAKLLRFIVRDSASGRMGSFDLPIPRH